MTPADQYRIRAAELRAKAHEERNARLAAEYDHLAKSYIRLAEQADRNQNLDVTYEPRPPTIPKE
jgi:hypothetical protein